MTVKDMKEVFSLNESRKKTDKLGSVVILGGINIC